MATAPLTNKVLGKYEFQVEVGRGSYGVVYKVRSLGMFVAQCGVNLVFACVCVFVGVCLLVWLSVVMKIAPDR